MADTYNGKSVAQMCDRIEYYLSNEGTVAAGVALGDLVDGFAAFRRGMNPETRIIHAWSFLRPLATLALGAPVTGVAMNVLGVLTATGSIFNVSMVGQTISIADYDGGGTTLVATILSYTSPIAVVIDKNVVAYNFAAKAVTIAANGFADLPVTFGGLVEPFVGHNTPANQGIPIVQSEPTQIMSAWRDCPVPIDADTRPGVYLYAIVPTDPATSTPQGHRLMVAPLLAAVRVWNYRYLVRTLDITDTVIYLPGSPEYDDVIEAAGLAAAELRTGRTKGVMQAAFDRAMADAIAHDCAVNDPVGEESLSDVDFRPSRY